MSQKDRKAAAAVQVAPNVRRLTCSLAFGSRTKETGLRWEAECAAAIHGRADRRELRETDSDAVPALTKRHDVSEGSIYTWSKEFGTFQADDVRR